MLVQLFSLNYVVGWHVVMLFDRWKGACGLPSTSPIRGHTQARVPPPTISILIYPHLGKSKIGEAQTSIFQPLDDESVLRYRYLHTQTSQSVVLQETTCLNPLNSESVYTIANYRAKDSATGFCIACKLRMIFIFLNG